MQGLRYCIYQYSEYWEPLLAISCVSILLHLKMSINRASTECQQSINRLSTERQQSVNRASTEHQQSVNRASTEHQQSINTASIQCQQSVNDYRCCILYNASAVLRHIPRIIILAAFMSKRDCDMLTAPV